MNVVMAHGFWDTGRLFRTMSRELGALGHICHSPTLHPTDARLGIPDLSGKLADYVAANLDGGAPTAFVGFSMGALVVRHYLQELGGVRTGRAFFSIAGPHRGTPSAYFLIGLGTRQMRPGSAFLRHLAASCDVLNAIPVYTYRTPFDLMVVPPATTRISGASEVTVWCPFHSLMPTSPKVISHIAGELAKMGPVAASAR